VAIHVKLARPQLDRAAEAIGLQRPRRGEVDRVLDVLRVVARDCVDVDDGRNIIGDRLLPGAVADHRKVRDAIALSVGHVDQPAGDAGLDPLAFLAIGAQRDRQTTPCRQKAAQQPLKIKTHSSSLSSSASAARTPAVVP